jgi:hypothetical protein
MGVWQGVAMNSLKFHPSLPYPTLLHPAGGPPLKRPYDSFKGGPPLGQTACGRLQPFLDTPRRTPMPPSLRRENLELRQGKIRPEEKNASRICTQNYCFGENVYMKQESE